MINNEELGLSNRSYLNKDFARIYEELLTLTKNLTNRWDPTISNESDPGVVLLKLAAFIGDKISYNVDKNILESFMPSATQRTSMQNLCEMNGYDMKYFNSATLDLSIIYTGNDLASDGSRSFLLPKYSTTFTDDSGTIKYSLMDDCLISKSGVLHTIRAIEGTINTLNVGENNLIQLYNLDDNLRLYLPTSYVAENGIFITNKDSEELWTNVLNLNLVDPGTKAFKFGYNSITSQPYIQFPSDVASLIKDGLIVRYTVTSGRFGNVPRAKITKLLNQNTVTLQEDSTVSINLGSNLVVTNISASVDGRDPETIEEAYNNFKKTTGTFNTLVTCRDYSNYIYNLYNEALRRYWVSNVQVGDRRTDINYANSFISFDKYGTHKVNAEGDASGHKITAYDLALYPLEYSKPTDLESYNKTFKPLADPVELWEKIENDAEDVKCIPHDLKQLADDDIYCIKNYYTLNIQVHTHDKVNRTEQKDIIQNIKSELYDKFCSRYIDYGYEIPYDTLYNTILKADKRIKAINFPEPELLTKVMFANGDEQDMNGSSTYVDILAKNIIQGKVSLFDTEEDFSCEFGQNKINDKPIVENVEFISTKLTIDKKQLISEPGYELQKNEVVQVIAPTLADDVIYPERVYYNWTPDYGIMDSKPCKPESLLDVMYDTKTWGENFKKYKGKIYYLSGHVDAYGGRLIDEYGNTYALWESETPKYLGYGGNTIPGTDHVQTIIEYFTISDDELGEDGASRVIKANTNHKIIGNEVLDLYYSDNNSISHRVTYRASSIETDGVLKEVDENIICPTFNLEPINPNSNKEISTFNGKDYNVITTGNNITRKTYSSVVLKNPVIYCYWYLNNPENVLFRAGGDNTIMLDNGEYFIYTDSSFSTLNILGAGAKLTLGNSAPNTTWVVDRDVNLEDILEYGLDAISEENWYLARLSQRNLTIELLTVSTIGRGSLIQIVDQDLNTIADLPFDTLSTEIQDLSSTSENGKLIRYSVLYTDASGAKTVITPPEIDNHILKIRAMLSLNCGPKLSQPLLDRQSIELFDRDNNLITTFVGSSANTTDKDPTNDFQPYINCNYLIQRMGGNNLRLRDNIIRDSENEDEINIRFYYYSSADIKYPSGEVIVPNSAGEIIMNIMNISGAGNKVNLPVLPMGGSTELFLVYNNYQGKDSINTIIESDVPSGIRLYNSGNDFSKELTLESDSLGIIEINTESNISNISVYVTGVDDENPVNASVIIGKPLVGYGLNKAFGEDVNLDDLLKIIKDYTTVNGKQLFNYTAPIDNSYAINSEDLTDPLSYYDVNNIANRWTISQIDFNNSTFVVSKSSRI